MNKSFSAIVVDDEQPAVSLLVSLLKNFPEIEIIGRFTHAPTALRFVIDEKPELIFLDINMPEISGIDVAKIIIDLNLNIQVIFITAYDEFILDALRSNAVDYLLKPVSVNELRMAIERLKANQKNPLNLNLVNLFQQQQKPNLRFNTRNGFIIFPEEDILFILADGVYSKFQLKNGKEMMVSQNIGKIEAMLNLPHLVKIHRACIINTKYIFEVNKGKKKCLISYRDQMFQLPLSSNGLKLLNNHFSF